MQQRTLIATSVTLADLARAVDVDERPFVLAGQWANGAVIAGSAPLRVLDRADDPFAALDDLPERTPSPDDLTFGGGWVGHLGFALAGDLETLPPSPPVRGATAGAHGLAFYDHVLVLDPDGRCWLEHLDLPGRQSALAARADVLRARLATHAPALPTARVEGLALSEEQANAHGAAIEAVLARIRAGEIFQANLCLRLHGTLDGSPLDAWLSLMAPEPAAYGAYVRDGERALLSCSPELFLHRAGREVHSAPMKGTRRRDDDEDTSAAELAAAPKDSAENVMIVDLMRNDLGRVCEYGSIHVDRAEVQAHPGVWQLVRRVRGTLRPDVSDATLVRACFPPGSVVGAPKIQALKVIAAEETAARGAYCGAIGYASPYAGLMLSVAIRTLEVDGNQVALGVGGGIVADSVAADEIAECETKAAPLRRALGLTTPAVSRIHAAPPLASVPALLADGRGRPDPTAGLLETIALADGVAVAIDAHLDRLAHSARTLFGSQPELAVPRTEVQALAAAGAAAARLVAVPARSGWTVTVTARPAPAPTREAIALTPTVLPGGLGAHKWADRTTLSAAPAATAWLVCDRTGEVLEAAWANVWIREGDAVITPPADGRLLPGIRRAAILADPSQVGAAEARTEPLTLDRLRGANAVFLTSALRVVQAELSATVVEQAVLAPAGYHR